MDSYEPLPTFQSAAKILNPGFQQLKVTNTLNVLLHDVSTVEALIRTIRECFHEYLGDYRVDPGKISREWIWSCILQLSWNAIC